MVAKKPPDGITLIAENRRARFDYAVLMGLKIEKWKNATHVVHEVDRTRKLLAHKDEIAKLTKLTREKGVTLVPMKLYFKGAWAKVLIGVGEGKTHEDRREDIKRREADRDVARVMRRGRR